MLADRRSILAGLGAVSALTALPATGARTSRLRGVRPPRLRPGDTLGIVAPAGFVGDRFGIEEVGDSVRAMGLEPKFAPNLTARAGYLAGDDEARAAAFMAMHADPEVRALMAVRGGWGCARILPLLDYGRLARDPKLFVGFSDNTALHLALQAHTGVVSIHGPNASAGWTPVDWQSFRTLAFEGEMPLYTVPTETAGGFGRFAGRLRTFAPGKARGRLLGGNLSVLSALVGTPFLPDFSGAILFLEDTNEAEYRIDRMLTQLALSGVLGKVAGVVFGQCTRCTNPDSGYANYTIYEVMDQHLGKLGVPAFQGGNFGHMAGQWSLPEGALAEIDADAGTIRLLEPAVA
jgi:muramoyltetrapeptide carboxypeptidase